MPDQDDRGEFGGDYARDPHRGGLGDDYARDGGWSGAGRADDYAREPKNERPTQQDDVDATVEITAGLGKASE
jgi:hypothetical protein